MNSSFFILHSSLPFGAPRRKAGFSLVEISMVLLLFATAIGGLLSFFPVGLRLENNAISDSAQTMFALNVLAQAETRAALITDWDVWNNTTKFRDAVFKNIEVDLNGKKTKLNPHWESWTGDGENNGKAWRTKDDSQALVGSYLTSRSNIRYILQVSPVETPIYFGDKKVSGRPALGYRMRRVAIWVTDRRDGDPFLNAPFTLQLFFQPDYSKVVWKNAEGEI